MPSKKMQKPELAALASAQQSPQMFKQDVHYSTVLSQTSTDVNYKNCTIFNTTPLTKHLKSYRKTHKKNAPRRFAIDIGKNISLALMAEKYDFDPRIDGDGGAE